MLKLNNISKKFEGLIALDNFSYELEKGRIIALVGPNGSGKTTLFNIITGFVKKDKGSVYFEDKNISELEAHHIAKLGISRTFQQVNYFQNLTLFDHLLLCFNDTDSIFFNLFYKKGNKDKIKKIKKIMVLVGLQKPLNTKVSELSYGQKKLVGLAMALLREHNLIFLDEPVAGVNPILKNKIKNILLGLKKKGETVFIVEHDINFVKEVADEVVVLDRGRIMAFGSPNLVFNNENVIKAYVGN